MSISCARLLCDGYETGNCIVQCAVIISLYFRKTRKYLTINTKTYKIVKKTFL